MSQNIEIEFKNLLTEEEFTLLKKHLNMDESLFITQVNHYFDTENFTLKGHGCALRIREKNGSFELTLKQPHPEGLLETNQIISEVEAKSVLGKNAFINGPVKEAILKLGIEPEELSYFGSLTTNRAEKEYKGGLVVLDYSTYLNQFDYEVEYEVKDFQQGKKIFENLLRELHIPIRQTENKIRRFYEIRKSLEASQLPKS